MENELVCCVISSWNRLDILKQNISAINNQDYKNKVIIVVDNCSSDGTQDYLRALKLSETSVLYVLMNNSKNSAMKTLNIGFNYARDLGANYILVLDDDCILQEEHSITRLVEVAKSDPNIGMVACNVRGPDSLLSQTDFKFALNTHIDLKNIPSEPFEVYDYIGACALYNTEVFQNYDESFNIYWNEADTALNIISRGYKVLFEPSIRPIHLYSTKQRNINKGVYFYVKNGNTIINRYLTFKNRFVIISVRFFCMMLWIVNFKSLSLIIKSLLVSILGFMQIFYMPSRHYAINDDIQNKINQAYTGWYFRKFYEWIFGYSVYEV